MFGNGDRRTLADWLRLSNALLVGCFNCVLGFVFVVNIKVPTAWLIIAGIACYWGKT